LSDELVADQVNDQVNERFQLVSSNSKCNLQCETSSEYPEVETVSDMKATLQTLC